MKLIYEERVSEDFKNKVIEISARLGVNPNWLMAIMKFESGLSHTIVNPTGGATGLIQFMPATARYLGTSTSELRKMTAVEQLEYVYKYYKPYKSKLKSFVDMYLTTFMPISVGKPLNWVFETNRLSKEIIAKQNPVFDLNKDRKLTIAEVEKVMLDRLPRNWKDYFKNSSKRLKKKAQS